MHLLMLASSNCLKSWPPIARNSLMRVSRHGVKTNLAVLLAYLYVDSMHSTQVKYMDKTHKVHFVYLGGKGDWVWLRKAYALYPGWSSKRVCHLCNQQDPTHYVLAVYTNIELLREPNTH